MKIEKMASSLFNFELKVCSADTFSSIKIVELIELGIQDCEQHFITNDVVISGPILISIYFSTFM